MKRITKEALQRAQEIERMWMDDEDSLEAARAFFHFTFGDDIQCADAACDCHKLEAQELPRCLYPVDGKSCGVYAPKGEDYCREHTFSLRENVGQGCCSPDNPCDV